MQNEEYVPLGNFSILADQFLMVGFGNQEMCGISTEQTQASMQQVWGFPGYINFIMILHNWIICIFVTPGLVIKLKNF